MLAKHFLELRRIQMIRALEDEAHQIHIGTVAVYGRRYTQRFDLAQVQLAFLAHETAIETVTFLRAPLRPRTADSRDTERNCGAIVPLDLQVRNDLADERQHARQD